MNEFSKINGLVLNSDGVTYRYPGIMQWPMTAEQQKSAGLIAKVNVSIHPRKTLDGKTVWHNQGRGK